MSQLNWNSRSLTRGWQRGIQAFYWGLGWKEEDFDRPQIGIGTPLLDGNLCNLHAHALARRIADGCAEAGLIGLPFGVPAVSDNITQGHEGGRASLVSRNLIANSAEMVASSHCYDALVGLHHCDKNGPGFALALARLNYPGLIVSGGTIQPGCHEGRELTILDVYDAEAKVAQGLMNEESSAAILRHACPGAGGCGIAASFNTWGMVLEALGLMLPASSSNPATDPCKATEARQVGAAVRQLLADDLRPRRILTPAAFRNAAVTLAAAGGSTNGVLHLIALAREAGVAFGLRDLQSIFRCTPVLVNFAPRGRGTMVDLHRLGGTPSLLRHFLEAGLLDGRCLTVTGRSLAENVAGAPSFPENQDLVAPAARPFKPYADIQICFGNIAPAGVVFKASALGEPRFEGRAICFEDPREIVEAAAAGRILPGHVVVLRGLGPVAAAMPEVLVATAALSTPALKGKVALLSDTRVSGVSHGIIGVHCAPEAVVGGPIGRVRDGDAIRFDLLAGTISCDADLTSRPAIPTPPLADRGYLADWAATVSQADDGCVSRWVLTPNQHPTHAV